MNFARAFIQDLGTGSRGREEHLVMNECEARGIPVTRFTIKKIHRRQLPLAVDAFIAGTVDAMHGAMRQLKIEPPAPEYYPPSLKPFLYRHIWKSELGALEHRLLGDGGTPAFAKPASRAKSFTGQVFSSHDDFWTIGGVSRREEIWCSEPVEWLSEWRVYVNGNEVVSIDHYSGDPARTLDRKALDEALALYRSSGEAPAAYGIDFGVLASGETALVEANDGYSLGAYSIGAREYTDLLFARWRELLSTRHGPPT